MEPSQNWTIEWIIDCRWTITSICAGARLNSHRASITSRPLFIKVAESIVILAPISQQGCFKASFLVIFFRYSASLSTKGPPDAVRIIFSMESCSSPCKHWNIAECSESTGNIFTLFSVASLVISSPPTTSVSLLASAISFFHLIALIVGNKPA